MKTHSLKISGSFKVRQLRAALLSLLAALPCSAADASQPNILFIAVDDLRPELGCYGAAEVKSPYIDQLASQGVLFTRAYCQVPVCGASRASLMTGILPTASRFTNAGTRADKDAPHATVLPTVFKNAGYTTLSNGKIFHDSDDNADQAWSEKPWHSPIDNLTALDPDSRKKLSKAGRGRIYEAIDTADNAYPDGQTAEKTIADLRRLKESSKPFFIACGFLRPHMPFYAPKKYWDLYEREKIQIADNRTRPQDAPAALKGSSEYTSYELDGFDKKSAEFHRMMRHGYYASVSYADKLVGDILAELDRLDLAKNTIVVLWGDHGWQLGEHDFWGKHNTMHKALQVPLIVRSPGKALGQRGAGLVQTIDIYPTLCELAGLTVPESVQGRSFVPLLADPKKDFRDTVYSRFQEADAVVTKDFSYTSYGKRGEMLYDLKKDPQENHNLAGKPEYADTLATLKNQLQESLAEAKKATP